MGTALETFVEEAKHLSDHFASQTVFSIAGWDVTQYTLWLFIAIAVTLIVLLSAAKKLTLVPDNKLSKIIEYLYNFVNTNIGEDIIGHGFKQHIPFLATLFFFILVSNILGLVPGFKTGTGSLSITWALAVISFIYFNFWGSKSMGPVGYATTLVPSGTPWYMVPIVWFLEFFSMIIRPLTLAVRLYGNMLAGHMVLAVFALATTIFIQSSLMGASMNLVGALPSVAWFFLLVVMYAMECLVAFLQAFVFAVLSSSYIGSAIHKH